METAAGEAKHFDGDAIVSDIDDLIDGAQGVITTLLRYKVQTKTGSFTVDNLDLRAYYQCDSSSHISVILPHWYSAGIGEGQEVSFMKVGSGDVIFVADAGLSPNALHIPAAYATTYGGEDACYAAEVGSVVTAVAVNNPSNGHSEWDIFGDMRLIA